MQKITLIHNCLSFQHKKQKYIYGITYSLFTSSYLTKYKPNYIIIPSHPFIGSVFVHACIEYIIQKQKIKNNKMNKKYTNQPNTQTNILNKILNYCKILIINQKTLQAVCISQQIKNLIDTQKINLLSKHQIQLHQQKIMQLYNKLTLLQYQKNTTNNLQQHQNVQILDWLNCPKYQLKIIIPEHGMTTYLCQGTNIIVVDPTQQFINYMQYTPIIKNSKYYPNIKNIPNLLHFLHTVIITKMMSIYAVLGLMVMAGIDRIRVIVINKQLQQAIIQLSYRYLYFTQEITRSRLLIRNISQQIPTKNYQFQQNYKNYSILSQCNNPYNIQLTNIISCTFYPLSPTNQCRLQLTYGSSTSLKSNKKIIFYSPSSASKVNHFKQPQQQLQHFPQQIKQNNVQYIILYKVQQQLIKQLKALPQLLRKKIILNRNQHKYNHKYFVTFQKNNIEFCTIVNVQYLQLTNYNNKGFSYGKNSKNYYVGFKDVKQWSINMLMTGVQVGSKICELKNGQEIQSCGYVVQIGVGIAEMLVQGIQGKENKTIIVGGNQWNKRKLTNVLKIKAVKYAQIKMLMQCDLSLSTSIKDVQKSFQQSSTSHLITLSITQKKQYLPSIKLTLNPPNTFSPNISQSHLSTIQNNSLLKTLSKAQLQKLNQLCRSITYQVGFKTNTKNQSLYLISKGGMKWQDKDQIAGNGYFIGDMRSFYQKQSYEFDNYIEVVKDTWALEINIEQFHQYFLLQYPDVLHFILLKQKIFK